MTGGLRRLKSLGRGRVAQSDRALASGARGRGFESRRALHTLAGVAELVDALDSGSSGRKPVGVQVPPPAPFINPS